MSAPLPPMPYSLQFEPVVGEIRPVLAPSQRNYVSGGNLTADTHFVKPGVYMVQAATSGAESIELTIYTYGRFSNIRVIPAGAVGQPRTGSLTVSWSGTHTRLLVRYPNVATETTREVAVNLFPVELFKP